MKLKVNDLIPEANIYGGFPVSGQWLVCNDSNISRKHHAKVYGKSALGAPPMSVPHLDTRWVEGKRSLLFGPFAGANTKFLKNGSNTDFFKSINLENMQPMIQAGIKNFNSSISGQKKEISRKHFLVLESEISRAASKGFIKKNTASRMVSKLSEKLKLNSK